LPVQLKIRVLSSPSECYQAFGAAPAIIEQDDCIVCQPISQYFNGWPACPRSHRRGTVYHEQIDRRFQEANK
jgi:hypothetical protein